MTTSKVRIGDVLELNRTPISLNEQTEYRAIGIRSFGKGVFEYPPVRSNELSKLRYFTFPSGALALSNIKAWEGAIAMTDGHAEGAIASNRFLFYTEKSPEVYVPYLCYYFLSEGGIHQICQASPGSADRNRTLSIKNFENIKVSLPDLDEQRRIAAKLDSIHGKIQRSLEFIESGSELRTQLLNVSLQETKESAPMGKFLSKSEDLVNVIPEKRYETAGIYSYGRGLFRRPTTYGSETKYPRYNRLHRGQFVYSKLFAWEGSATVVPEEFEGVYVSQEFPTFDIDASVADPTYVFHLTRWPELRKRLDAGTVGMGSRRQRVNVNQLLATEVPLPDLPTQRAIAKKLDKLGHAEMEHAKQKEHLKALRSSLLNAAFSGKL